ncbi:hypothetical protein V8C26DRAFT_413560 [Trichoderma gracile]
MPTPSWPNIGSKAFAFSFFFPFLFYFLFSQQGGKGLGHGSACSVIPARRRSSSCVTRVLSYKYCLLVPSFVSCTRAYATATYMHKQTPNSCGTPYLEKRRDT